MYFYSQMTCFLYWQSKGSHNKIIKLTNDLVELLGNKISLKSTNYNAHEQSGKEIKAAILLIVASKKHKTNKFNKRNIKYIQKYIDNWKKFCVWIGRLISNG